MSAPTHNPLPVFTVVERPHAPCIWLRVGTAWENRDGTITVKLDALPANGILQIRPAPPERVVG